MIHNTPDIDNRAMVRKYSLPASLTNTYIDKDITIAARSGTIFIQSISWFPFCTLLKIAMD